jgi:hypothetical protein
MVKKSTGTLIQAAIISYIKNCSSNCIFKDGSDYFLIGGESVFIHVNKQTNKFSMNFKQICETASKNKILNKLDHPFIFGTPVKK